MNYYTMTQQSYSYYTLKSILLGAFMFFALESKCEKSIHASTQESLAVDTLLVGNSEAYTTIQMAYDAIPMPPDKEYWILIQVDYNPLAETFPITFANDNPDSNNRINIMPNVGVVGTVIAGDPGPNLPLIDYFQADHVVFDGRPGGAGTGDLTMRNTRIVGDAGAVINLQEDASNNIFRHLTIEGEPDVTGFNALINIGQTTGTKGNDSNTVSNCVISDLTVGGTALYPLAGIRSNGSFGATNDYLVIDSCNVIDIWGGTNNSSAYIHIQNESTNFRITNNHLYQTASLASADFQSSFIQIDAGGDHIIDGNFIGGRAPNAGGAPFTITSGQAPLAMIGVGFGVQSGDSITITNNTLANFNVTTTNMMGASPGLVGIYNTGSGVRTIGTIGNGNIIGSATTGGSIVMTDNNAMSSNSFAAILNSANDTTYIVGNTIGGITLTGSIIDVNAYMIYNEFGNVVVIDNNTIGGTNANSIMINSDVRCQGISNNAFSGNGVEVSNNTIRNVNHSAAKWPFVAIQNDQDSIYCSGNTIGDITVSSDSGMVGIAHYAFADPADINNNTIQKITISNVGGGASFFGIEAQTDGNVRVAGNSIGNATANNISIVSNATSIGIYVDGAGEYEVDSNTVQNFNQTSTGSSAEVIGLAVLEGGVTATNNTITKLTSSTSGSLESIIGIYVESDYPFYIIEGNTITDLEAVTTNGPDISGISLNSDVAGGYSAVVESNFISGLVGTNTSSATLIQGIYWYDGDVQISNNVVLLNNNGNNNATTIIGLYQDAPAGPGQNDIYHNTVSIEGVQAAGANTSVAYRIDGNNSTIVNNNIFKNIRSGGSGNYFAIEATNSGAYTVDYNFYDVAGAQPFSYGGTNRSFPQWQTSISGDGNSISGVELLDSEGRPTASFAGKDAGTDISGIITDDFSGAPRDAMPWMGAFEGAAVGSGNKYVNDATFAGGDWTTSPGADVGGCGNANNPCATVQFAINEGSTSPGDTIFVDVGNYSTEFNTNITKGVVILGYSQNTVTFEDVSAATDRRMFNVMSSGVVLKNMTIKGFNATTNGFPRGGAIRIEEVDNYTEIDSVYFENNQAVDGGAIGVRKSGGALNTILISNSTFVSNSVTSNGGAISVEDVGGQITMEIFDNCVLGGSAVNANTAANQGGAIFFNADTLRVDSSTISYNNSSAVVTAAGAIYALDVDEITIANSIFNSNSTSNGGISAAGGAIILDNSLLDVERTIFQGNSCNQQGGVFFVYNGGDLYAVNCLFIDNQSKAEGAVLYLDDGVADFMNCTFSNNVSDSDNDSGTPHAVLEVAGGHQIDVTNSIFWNNSSSGNLDVIEGGGTLNLLNCVYETSVAGADFTDLGNNIIGNPQFTNTAGDDYTIANSSSSAVDAGTGAGAPANDLNGDVRPQGSGIDIGAYESGFNAADYPVVVGSGSTVKFDGSTKYGATPSAAAIDLVGDWTIEAWIKRNTIGTQHSIVEKYNNAGGFGGYALRINGANKLTALHFNGTTFDQAIGTTNILANKWYHVAATFNDASNTLTVYVNGISDGASPASLAPLSSSVDLKIGARGNDLATKMDGEIDEVRLWSTVLTVSEIREYMCQKVTVSHPQSGNARAVYPFDDTDSPGILQDLLGDNNATFNGVVAGDWVTSGAPIGDTSVFNYGGSSLSASLDAVNNNDFAVSDYAGVVNGMHIYFVNDTINSPAVPSGMSNIDSVGYYGVFKVGASDASYTATIDYTNNTAINGQPNEENIRIANRAGNDAGSTTLATGIIRTNTTTNTITLPGQTGTEFVVGFAVGGYPDEPGPGYTLAMDGVNEFISQPTVATAQSNNVTFEAWVNWDGSSAGTARTILLNGNSGTNGQHLFLNAGTNEVMANFGGVGSFGSGYFMQPGKWTHVALVGDGANQWVIYINGVPQGTGVHAPNIPSGVFRIGANQAVGQVFPGQIDEVRVWNINVSQNNIRDYICNKTLNNHPNFGNLVSYFRFDEGVGNTTTDLVTGGTMTLNNMEAADWVYSGAYIGDSSVHNYVNSNDIVLASPQGGAITIKNFDAVSDSLHLYYVADTANDLSGPIGVDSLDKRNYWGVWQGIIGSSEPYNQIKIDYASHADLPGHVNEAGTRVVGRSDASTLATWGFPNSPTTIANYAANDSIVMDSIRGSYEFILAYAEPVGPNYYVNDAALAGDSYTFGVGSDVANCGTQSSPCASVQYVLDNYALAGDTIFIDAGNYADTNIYVNVDDAVFMGLDTALTVFDGSIVGGDSSRAFFFDGVPVNVNKIRFTNYNASNYRGGLIAGGTFKLFDIADTAIINNVVVENSQAQGGAGILVQNESSSNARFLLSNSRFSNNTTGANGGVLRTLEMGATSLVVSLDNVEMSNNSAFNGAAIYHEADSLIVNASAFILNDVSAFNGNGGAIYSVRDAVEIDSSLFKDSYANGVTGLGGAIYLPNGNATITNSDFQENVAKNSGGSIFVGSGVEVDISYTDFRTDTAAGGGSIKLSATSSVVSLDSVIFDGNYSTTRGGAIENGGRLIISRSLFNNNSANVSGGALRCISSADVFATEVTFTSNSAPEGGAVEFEADTLSFDTCIFIMNTSSVTGGGAINVTAGSPVVLVDECSLNLNQAAAGSGGAIRMTAANAQLFVTNGTSFSSNSAQNGGAIEFGSDTMSITNSVFVNNTGTTSSGAIRFGGASDSYIRKTYFDNNQGTAANGGALSVNGGAQTLTVEQSVFTNNRSGASGAAISNFGTLDVVNSLFYDNGPLGAGNGVIFFSTTSNGSIYNSTFTDNLFGGGGTGGVHSASNNAISLVNNIFWNNTNDDVINAGTGTTLASYSIIESGLYTVGAGISTSDPLFTNVGTDDFTLSLGSPGINNGTAVGAPSVDLNDSIRPFAGFYDMGVYEAQFCSNALLVTSSANDSVCGTLRFALGEAITNPGADTITFDTLVMGGHTIQPLTPLPTIAGANAHGTVIWGDLGNDNTADIELDGSLMATVGSDSAGVHIQADTVTIKGLVINRFNGSGVLFDNADTGFVIGCYLGSTYDGTDTAGNNIGVNLVNGSRANTIGDGTQFGGNLIGGNDGEINIELSNSNRFFGNKIATNLAGTDYLGGVLGKVGNGGFSIANADSSIIGDTAQYHGNTISGKQFGFFVGNADYMVIRGNYIGTDETGTANIGVAGGGHGMALNGVNESLIDYNMIANHQGSGIRYPASNSFDNLMHYNTFWNNATQGALFFQDPAAQRSVQPPTISTLFSDSTLYGTSAPNAFIQIYADSTDEGYYFIDTTTADASGGWSLKIDLSSLAAGVDFLRALQDSLNNTSDFTSGFIIDLCDPLVVTKATDDSVCGDLRYAIAFANSNPGADTITFDTTSMGGHTITIVNGELPAISSDSLMIDGDLSADGDPDVEIWGGLTASGENGLLINASQVVIRGLVINKFDGYGLSMTGGANDFISVLGSFIGTDYSGTIDSGNVVGGVFINGPNDVSIGDGTVAGRNVISGNDGYGMRIVGTSNSSLYGNYIGVDKTGLVDLGNNTIGIDVTSTTNTTFGDSTSGFGNVISGNNSAGIRFNSSDGNVIAGNIIGLDAVGSGVIPNNIDGVLLLGGSNFDTIRNNVIAHNVGRGIQIFSATTNDNIIYNNSIFGNTGLGIEITSVGAQRDVLMPSITSLSIVGSDTIVSGTSSPNALIQIYCDSTHEGQAFLDTTTADASGDWSKVINGYGVYDANGLDSLTALQDSAGNTSAFSLPFFKSPVCSNPLLVTELDDDSTCGDIRFAMAYAINNPGPDTITFDASLANGVVTLTSILPALSTDSTVINGDFIGSDCLPDITIDGGDLAFDGFELSGNHNVLKGLNLINFAGSTSNAAVYIDGGDSNTVICSYIGTNLGGTAVSGATDNDIGVYVTNGGEGNLIGDSTGSTVNLICGNTTYGVYLEDVDTNFVVANLIGLDMIGSTGLGNNDHGVFLEGADGNFIISNIISDNGATGVMLDNSNGNLVSGNNIGGNFAGTTDIGNTEQGVMLTNGSSGNSIGGSTLSRRNFIIGNNGGGVEIETDNNRVSGNFIGIGKDGVTAIPNSSGGITLTQGASSNFIGDTTFYGRNVVSGNTGHGITISNAGGPASNNFIIGNYIGTDSTGTLDRGNTNNGINVASEGNTIGTGLDNARNVISGNGFNGISITATNGNIIIAGNLIGLTADSLALGNSISGVQITGGSNDTLFYNIIAYNTNSGISISGAATDKHIVRANSIFKNGSIGISHVSNAQENVLAPVITSLAVVGSDTIISGTSEQNALIQIFCDSTNQGQVLLDTTLADASGNWSKIINGFNVFSASGLDSLTALQDSAGNTSEFSLPFSKFICDTTNAIGGTWTWTGAVSSDWFDCGNWDTGSLPNSQVDVLIPGATANDPMIAAGTAYCKRIDINVSNGAVVNLNSSGGGFLNIGP